MVHSRFAMLFFLFYGVLETVSHKTHYFSDDISVEYKNCDETHKYVCEYKG